ncbi:MAG TPA: hypothetical protein VGL17_10895 [Gemmatimonadaceae bacterium]
MPAGSFEVIEPGGGAALTVNEAVPLWPSLDAMMFVVPGATAVMRPDPETVAMAAEPELHVTARPVNTLLDASRVVAVAWVLPPTIRLFDASATPTDATGAVDGTG